MYPLCFTRLQEEITGSTDCSEDDRGEEERFLRKRFPLFFILRPPLMPVCFLMKSLCLLFSPPASPAAVPCACAVLRAVSEAKVASCGRQPNSAPGAQWHAVSSASRRKNSLQEREKGKVG